MIRISILRLKLSQRLRPALCPIRSTNDKNLNSEIETMKPKLLQRKQLKEAYQ